jgi:hypothetical protein
MTWNVILRYIFIIKIKLKEHSKYNVLYKIWWWTCHGFSRYTRAYSKIT